MRPRTGDLLACLVLSTLTLGCFARLATQPRGLIVDGERPSIDYAQRDDPRPVGNDLTFSFLPRYLQVSETVARTGRPPLWDVAGFGGRPLVGNPQGGLFYPPAWLAWIMRSPAMLGWLTIGHLLWGGLGVYVLTRGLGLGRWPAIVAAGCLAAAPYLLAQTVEGHYPHVWAAGWYPWAFWAFGGHRRGRLWGTLALPPILALDFLTGHPQEWYYLVLALSLWALFDAYHLGRTGSWRKAAGALLLWGSLLALTIGLAAAELIPDLAAQGSTLRTARMTLRQASKYHLHAINLMQLLGPDALGGPSGFFGDGNYWETVLSIGIVPLVLATIAVARHPERTLVRSFAGAHAAVVIVRGGASVRRLFRAVHARPWNGTIPRSRPVALPGQPRRGGTLRTRSRHAPEAHPTRQSLARLGGYYWLGATAILVGLLVLRALGGPFDLDWVPQRPHSQAIRYGQAWTPTEASPGPRVSHAAARLLHSGLFWLGLGGTGALVALGQSATAAKRRRGTVAAALLGGLALVEVGLHGHRVVRVAPAEQFLGRDPISTVLRTVAPDVSGPFRIRARDTLYPDIHAFANGIEKININDGFQLQYPADLYQTLYPLLYRTAPPDPDEPMSAAAAQFHREVRQSVLDRLNVAFLVSDHIEPVPSWPLVATGVWNGNDFAIHRNPTVLPRAYVVPRPARRRRCRDRARGVSPDQPARGGRDGPRPAWHRCAGATAAVHAGGVAFEHPRPGRPRGHDRRTRLARGRRHLDARLDRTRRRPPRPDPPRQPHPAP